LLGQFGCVQKSLDQAECGCLNSCSGVGTCVNSVCKCPAGKYRDMVLP